MAEFLTTRGTANQLEQLIQEAENQLTLITPYIQIPPGLLPRLRAADARGVKTRLLIRTENLKLDEREKLSELRNLSLYSLGNLHAKCYANERAVLVSSMNLYAYSEQNNFETSVLLTEEDGGAIRKARAELEVFFGEATYHPPQRGLRAFIGRAIGKSEPPVKAPARVSAKGFCIRCAGGIRYSPKAPLCEKCYASWAAWGNENYVEQNCHRCGKDENVTKARPLCSPCFREAPFASGSW